MSSSMFSCRIQSSSRCSIRVSMIRLERKSHLVTTIVWRGWPCQRRFHLRRRDLRVHLGRMLKAMTEIERAQRVLALAIAALDWDCIRSRLLIRSWKLLNWSIRISLEKLCRNCWNWIDWLDYLLMILIQYTLIIWLLSAILNWIRIIKLKIMLKEPSKLLSP